MAPHFVLIVSLDLGAMFVDLYVYNSYHILN
jgi:hypothetical protein